MADSIFQPIDYNKRVYIYWNLHRKMWSVRQSGKVVEHGFLFSLRDCRFLVSEAGRQRVLAEKKKNVHAGVSGYMMKDPISVSRMIYNGEGPLEFVTYNPYKFKSFVTNHDEIPVRGAEFVEMYVFDGIPSVVAMHPVYNNDMERIHESLKE